MTNEVLSKKAIIVCIGLAMLASFTGAALATPVSLFVQSFFTAPESPYGYSSVGWCNVVAIRVHGMILATQSEVPMSDMVQISNSDGSTKVSAPNYTISSDVEDVISSAASDPLIKGFLIDVDSPGGGVVASREIAMAIRNAGKPSVSVIHEIGASGGYMSASAAERVFASQDSEVGSIGVTQSYVTQVEKNKKDGYQFQQLSSGKFKNMLSPDKPLTDEERQLVMRDLDITHKDFVKLVAENRNLPIDTVERLADGSTMVGSMAKEKGLIDEFGGVNDAISYLNSKIKEPVAICWH